jgi:protein-S-isoprenylcysteine O-methyltransferase Ste14
MRLSDELIRQGNWLFRWRSYLPLAILPAFAFAFMDSGWFAARFGEAASDDLDLCCLAIALAGLVVRVLTVGFVPSGTSGRTTRRQHAEILNTTGMYSILRHPLYLANFLVLLGVTLALKSASLTLFTAAAFALYYERIIVAEENFLDLIHGEKFRRWAELTPAIWPRPRLWMPAALPFSWRTVLLREYHGLTLIVIIFFGFKLLEGLLLRHLTPSQWVAANPFYGVMIVAGLTFYSVVRLVRKQTLWLEVAGRGP